MKSKPCVIVFNTRWGYILTPIECPSIRAAERLAREEGMAFRIFVDGRLVKSGWYA